MGNVLSALGRAATGGAEDVPELHPPVEQEGLLGSLVGRQVRQGEVSKGRIDAVHIPGARLGLDHDVHVLVKHGLGEFVVVGAAEVLVDVRVEHVARLVGGVGRAWRALAVDHAGRTVHGHWARVHLDHLGHVGVLHGDGGRWGEWERAGNERGLVQMGGRDGRWSVVLVMAPRCCRWQATIAAWTGPQAVATGREVGGVGEARAGGAFAISCGAQGAGATQMQCDRAKWRLWVAAGGLLTS